MLFKFKNQVKCLKINNVKFLRPKPKSLFEFMNIIQVNINPVYHQDDKQRYKDTKEYYLQKINILKKTQKLSNTLILKKLQRHFETVKFLNLFENFLNQYLIQIKVNNLNIDDSCAIYEQTNIL